MTSAYEQSLFSRSVLDTRTTRGIADALATSPDPGVVRRRWGIIAAVNETTDTVDVLIGGVTIPDLQHDANYTPSAGERVYIDVVGTDLIVAGTTAPSGLNPPPPYVPPANRINQRTATVTAIGSGTALTLRLDDNSVVSGTRLATYIPLVNDVVYVAQVGNTFVAFGTTTITSRSYRRPTGEIQPTLLRSAPQDTLFLQGQTVSRTTYAVLWSWVQANNLVQAGLFTNGDGSTTFGLPDFRDRTTIGANTGQNGTGDTGTVVGANSRSLTEAQMPAHKHDVGVAQHGAHKHDVTVADHTGHSHTGSAASGGSHYHSNSFNTSSAGSHGAHPPYQIPVQAGSGANDVWAGGGVNTGSHSHSVSGDTSTTGAHTHSVTVNASSAQSHSPAETSVALAHSVSESTKGSTSAVDMRQASIAVNWIIWV